MYSSVSICREIKCLSIYCLLVCEGLSEGLLQASPLPHSTHTAWWAHHPHTCSVPELVGSMVLPSQEKPLTT